MKTVVVVISHGYMAYETLNSVEMILGKVENVYSFALLSEDSTETASKRLTELFNSLEGFDQVIIFADLLGGTPCNLALKEIINRENYHLISGFNLGMVIETVISANNELDLEIGKIPESGISNITNVRDKLKDKTYVD